MRLALLAALLLALGSCGNPVPSVEGVWIAPDAPVVAPASDPPPALVLIGDVGKDRGEDTLRIVRAMARALERAPGAPVVVLGDVFYSVGLVGLCPGQDTSRFDCGARGTPEEQFESVFRAYRAGLPRNPVIAIGGNHDYAGGREAVANACRLLPTGGPGWRYVAQGCGLEEAHPVEVLDLGGVAVFLLDSQPMLDDAAWRERTLAALRVELERFHRERPGTALLVATHHPLETHGAHNGSRLGGAIRKDLRLLVSTLFPIALPLQHALGEDPYDANYRAYRRGLYRLFGDLPITAFVSGHDHSLQHVGIDHPGVRHQLVSGAGANRSRVKRMALDLIFTGRIARALGLRDELPAPRHRLLFGIGGEQTAPDLTGWGFATLTPVDSGLHVQFFDPAREAPIYSALLSWGGAGRAARSAPG
jgi:hypothetical protein